MDSLHTIKSPSTVPVSTFTSPFIGKTFAQLNDIFVAQIKPLQLFIHEYFIILDQQTLEDESCLIIAGDRWFDLDDENKRLRVDFYLALWYVSLAEHLGRFGEDLPRNRVWGIHNIDVNTVE